VRQPEPSSQSLTRNVSLEIDRVDWVDWARAKRRVGHRKLARMSQAVALAMVAARAAAFGCRHALAIDMPADGVALRPSSGREGSAVGASRAACRGCARDWTLTLALIEAQAKLCRTASSGVNGGSTDPPCGIGAATRLED
jgi:hypothetical protein